MCRQLKCDTIGRSIPEALLGAFPRDGSKGRGHAEGSSRHGTSSGISFFKNMSYVRQVAAHHFTRSTRRSPGRYPKLKNMSQFRESATLIRLTYLAGWTVT